MYQSIYNLIHELIYGGVTMTADMTLTTTLLSTFAVVSLVAIPFVIVYKVLRLIIG